MTNLHVNNNESQAYGGGIYLVGNSSPEMEQMLIRDNESTGNTGGGIASYSGGRPEISGSIIRNNRSALNGGGIFSQGNMWLTDVQVDSNISERSGGGISSNGNLTINRVSIQFNSAERSGGALITNGARPELNHILAIHNRCEQYGAGLYFYDNCNPTLIHATIGNNISGENGGGIYCTEDGTPTLRDCIIWGNEPEQVYFNSDGESNSITITYSNVQGGEEGIELNDNGDINWGDGSIDADPLFANAEEGDFNLTWDNVPEDDETKSPCIDSGHPDFDEDPDGTRADMGVYPFEQLFPEIAVEPENLNFGEIEVDSFRMLSITISNTGDMLLIGALRLIPGDTPAYSIDLDDLELSVNPGEQLNVPIIFEPPDQAEYMARLRIESNDPDQEVIEVELQGVGIVVPPDINIAPQALDFGPVNIENDRTLSFTISNNGEGRLEGTINLVEGEVPFEIRRNDPHFITIPGADLVVAITFSPRQREEFAAVVRVESNDPDEAVIDVELAGRGVGQPPVVENEIDSLIIIEDADLTFVADLTEVFSEEDGDDLTFLVTQANEHINHIIVEGTELYIHPEPDFNVFNTRMVVTCTDTIDDLSVSTGFTIRVNPLNDLPEEFDLITPDNNYVLMYDTTSHIDFSWEEATQTEWEIDSVKYNLNFLYTYNDDPQIYNISDILDSSKRVSILELDDHLHFARGFDPFEFFWWVEAVDDSGLTESNERFRIEIDYTNVNELEIQIPLSFSLSQNYPNPFNSETIIRFGIPSPSSVKLEVFDLHGKQVASLMQRHFKPGYHEVLWNANRFESGVYIVKLSSDKFNAYQRITLIK